MKVKLLTVRDFTHYDSDGTVLTQFPDFGNTLHNKGVEMILGIVFAGESPPEQYYVGMDNRAVVAAEDELDDLSGEPTANGYARVGITGGVVSEAVGGNYEVVTPILTFRATGGAWDNTVSRLFMANTDTSSGVLIATASLPSSISMTSGQVVTYRMAVGLDGCD